VEYYGPNPQMGSWYLAALRSGEELARVVGDETFAAECRDLFERGSRWLDEHLFTGSYYRHEVRPVLDPDQIAPGLRHRSMGSSDSAHPDLQLADGCLVDQLVGQYAATLVGLGDLLDPEHVRTALHTVHERNFQRDFSHHFNPMRSFVLGDEAGVLMCSYEPGRRPARPFPYFTEVMTGFEYTAATGLLQVGAVEEGLEIIRAVRARYDGARRNPFDEAECGHHYARALASWSAFAAWNAITYTGPTATLTVERRAHRGRSFWSTGTSFGTWTPDPTGVAGGTLEVVHGELLLDALVLDGVPHRPPQGRLTAAQPWTVTPGAGPA
jgi:non-lysosomal glucosylceramidase